MYSTSRQPNSDGQYEVLSSDEKDEDFPYVPSINDFNRRTRQWSFWSIIPWVISFLSTGLMLLVVARYSNISQMNPSGTFEKGFEFERGPLIESLRIKAAPFYGGFHFDVDGNASISQQPGEPRYVGTPSKEVDQAWIDLIDVRFIDLTHDEAEEIALTNSNEDYFQERFWVEPSAFHTLHCLNYLRESLHPEYYNTSRQNSEPKPWVPTHQLHIDHCIEMLRQSIMCSLDLTLIPKRIFGTSEEGPFWHADQDQMHVCRDFGAVREWLIERRSRCTTC